MTGYLRAAIIRTTTSLVTYAVRFGRDIGRREESNRCRRLSPIALCTTRHGYQRLYLPLSKPKRGGYAKFDVRGCANGQAETSLSR